MVVLQLWRPEHSPSRRARHAPSVACAAGESGGEEHAKLVLLRHGQSEWNLANRFTGWCDVDLTEQGIIEARNAGQLLKDEGIQLDVVMTSFLRRAVRSACLLLSVLDQCWVPMRKDPTLNEVHCGILTGENKARLAERISADRVMAWRRNYDLRPPCISDDAPLQAQHLADLRYRPLGEPPTLVPSCESLADCCARLEPWWECELVPALSRGGNVLVVSHGNTLRAIVKRLEGISHADIFNVDLPTAVPCVYSLDRDLRPIGPPHGTWGDPSAAAPLRRRGRFLVAEEEVLAAQRAMRSQVLTDIAVTTATPAGFSGVSTSPASLAAQSSDAMVYRDGLSFRVRSRPPSYFTEQSRLEAQARREYGLLRGRQRALPARRGFKKQVRAALVLIRHGYSEYNADRRFMGWAECELTDRGREEARLAGRLLQLAGVRRLQRVYTSVLSRAIKSAWLMLDEMELGWVPVQHEWRLNERHYGALQGVSKDAAVAQYGLPQVRAWRRGYLARPPAQQTRPAADRRYTHHSVVRGAAGGAVRVPEAESLEDARARMRPWLEEELWPRMRAAMEAARRDAARDDQAGKQAGVEGGAGGRRRAADGRAKDAGNDDVVNDDAVNGNAVSDDAVNDDAVNGVPAGAASDGRQGGASAGDGASAGASAEAFTDASVDASSADASVDASRSASAPVPEVPVFVISSSHNMLRAILMELEDLTPEQVEGLNVPYSIPLTLQFDETLTPIATPWAEAPLRRGWYVGDPDRVASVQGEIDDDLTSGRQPGPAPRPDLDDEAPPTVRRIC